MVKSTINLLLVSLWREGVSWELGGGATRYCNVPESSHLLTTIHSSSLSLFLNDIWLRHHVTCIYLSVVQNEWNCCRNTIPHLCRGVEGQVWNRGQLCPGPPVTPWLPLSSGLYLLPIWGVSWGGLYFSAYEVIVHHKCTSTVSPHTINIDAAKDDHSG